MRIDKSDVNQLLSRVGTASRTNFPLACADFFAYFDEHVPDNPLWLELQHDRTVKWSDFPQDPQGRWTMPTAREDRLSLAYDLFRTVAEQKDDGRKLLHHLYKRNFNENVRLFRDDFLAHLVDIAKEVLRREPGATIASGHREKQQKFGILDAPNLLAADLTTEPGRFGRAVVYFDLDDFKSVNARFTERVVDELVLPVVQRLVASAASGHGYTYAEGGDEMIILLPNATLGMGAAFADALRNLLESTEITVGDQMLRVTASFGVAAEEFDDDLPKAANLAKNFAKTHGKNCVAMALRVGHRLWPDTLSQDP